MNSDMPAVRGRVHQNLYLSTGSQQVDALVTVDTVSAGLAPSTPVAAVEVIAIDVSTSMRGPFDSTGDETAKIDYAITATVAALAEIRDGVRFAVIAGNHEARLIYPPEPRTTGRFPEDGRKTYDGERRTATMDPTTRVEAVTAVRALRPEGSTAMGTWLDLAGEILAEHPGAIRHALLLTDGKNEYESATALDAAIERNAGRFRCDCRGIGAQWVVPELRQISRGLLGSFGRIAEPSAMAEDFRVLTAESMSRTMAQVALRLRTPRGTRITRVKQTAPYVIDLTPHGEQVDERTSLYSTGPWGLEERDFHVAIEVPSAGTGDERLAGRLSFVAVLPDGSTAALEQGFVRTRPDGTREVRPEAMISAIWTDDPHVDTDPHPLVLLSTEQSDLEKLVERAGTAYRAGQLELAGEWLDEIRPRAAAAGMVQLVDRIDGLRDHATGTYALDDEGILDIELESSSVPWSTALSAGSGAAVRQTLHRRS